MRWLESKVRDKSQPMAELTSFCSSSAETKRRSLSKCALQTGFKIRAGEILNLINPKCLLYFQISNKKVEG